MLERSKKRETGPGPERARATDAGGDAKGKRIDLSKESFRGEARLSREAKANAQREIARAPKDAIKPTGGGGASERTKGGRIDLAKESMAGRAKLNEAARASEQKRLAAERAQKPRGPKG